MIAAHPAYTQGYLDLASALVNSGLLDDAVKTIDKALQLSPNNFDARKLQVRILLAHHEFAEALEQSLVLNQRVPDDIEVYGFLADAYIAAGDYKKAEEATQWMLNLRTGNVGALTHTARLREIFGDPEGAIRAWRMALDATPLTEPEQRASIEAEITRLNSRRSH